MLTVECPMAPADSHDLGQVYENCRLDLVALVRGKLDRRLGTRVDAEEIVQDAFLCATARWPEPITLGLPVLAWLKRIVLNRLVDRYREHLAKGKDYRLDVGLPDGQAD